MTASNFLLNGMVDKESFGIFPWVEKYEPHCIVTYLIRFNNTYTYHVCMFNFFFTVLFFAFLYLVYSICNVVSISDTLEEVCVPDITAVDMLGEYARSANIEGVVSRSSSRLIVVG